MGVKAIRVFCLPLCFVFAGSCHAEISGYVKSLWSNAETVIGERETVNLGINRARVTWRDNILRAQFLVSYDLEWRTGSYLDTFQYRLQQSLQVQPYWQLQKKWHSSIEEEGYHSLYRAYLKVPVGSVDLRFGRQQLNWSRTFLWSSFDRFNPYNPLQLEPDERQGIDALQLIWNLDNGKTLELAYLPDHGSAQRAGGLRYRFHLDTTDMDLLLADYGTVETAGVAAAGQLQQAGWRLEATANRTDNNTTYNDVVVSLDYTFTSDTTLIVEGLYRGDGAEDREHYDFFAYLAGQRTDLAKRYLGMSVRQGFEPIAGIDLTLLYNLDDGSRVWSPTLRYSPGRYEDLHVRVGMQYFEGSASSEFGRFNTLVFGEIQWFY